MTKRLGILVTIIAALFAASCSSSDPAEPMTSKWPAPTQLTIQFPAHFPPPVIPKNNRTTVEGVDLGRRLYYDPILSADSTQACASCHQFGFSFSDTLAFSLGITGAQGTRNSPGLHNAAWLPIAFWDGRAGSLEEQALEPVVNPIEMADTWANVEAKLQSHPDYQDRFGRAFGTDVITRNLVVKAIAQFERTFVSGESKYDAWLVTRDWQSAGFTAQQERGRALFENEVGDCFHCHRIDPFLTDQDFHNIGLDSLPTDLGRASFTGNPNDNFKFKTPSLRNVELTAPYMHDGRFETMEQVVGHYSNGGFQNPTTDPLIRPRGIGLGLTSEQIDDIVAFLKTFTDTAFANNPDLSNPFE